MNWLDKVALTVMAAVLVMLLHAGGVVSLSLRPMVQTMMGPSAVVQAEIEQRELQQAIELVERTDHPANASTTVARR